MGIMSFYILSWQAFERKEKEDREEKLKCQKRKFVKLWDWLAYPERTG